MNLDDTIVAVSSPPGAAPRGIVRLSGPDAISIADRLFSVPDGAGVSAETTKSLSQNDAQTSGESKRTRGAPANTRFHRRDAGATGPSEIVSNCYLDGRIAVGPTYLPCGVYLFRAPHSYTRQDVAELHLWGAIGVLGLVVEQCLSHGARSAEPGEFTARAYLAGAFDLSQVHAIAGMVAARSDQQLLAAERLLHGALGRIANAAREELADLLSQVEAALDFADEPIEFIAPGRLQQRLASVRRSLERTAAAGLRAERWGQLPRVLLMGPPNVGKSSLLNRLSGLDRAICSPMAGTTRDVLSAPLALGATECLLLDVAGEDDAITDLAARVQAAARRASDAADVQLHVVDIRHPETAPGTKQTQKPAILVVNKCDLVSDARRKAAVSSLAESARVPVCPVSAVTGLGCESLRTAIEAALHDRPIHEHDVMIALMTEHRQALQTSIDALDRAVDLATQSREGLEDAELVASELHIAASSLGTLVGQEQTEDLLGRIFSRFCIGK